ncbi:hypothetical protein [Photorhabdus akhurstii]|nr:hypothetical protein [Photorhabdus akhurstii]
MVTVSTGTVEAILAVADKDYSNQSVKKSGKKVIILHKSNEKAWSE